VIAAARNGDEDGKAELDGERGFPTSADSDIFGFPACLCDGCAMFLAGNGTRGATDDSRQKGQGSNAHH
jgi:hypothetical protein